MENPTKIYDKNEELHFLQKLHWATETNDVYFHFSNERITDSVKFVSVITEISTKCERQSNYGLYDDAIIIVIYENEYILNEMSISDGGYLKGTARFTRRDDPFIDLNLLGIQKKQYF